MDSTLGSALSWIFLCYHPYTRINGTPKTNYDFFSKILLRKLDKIWRFQGKNAFLIHASIQWKYIFKAKIIVFCHIKVIKAKLRHFLNKLAGRNRVKKEVWESIKSVSKYAFSKKKSNLPLFIDVLKTADIDPYWQSAPLPLQTCQRCLYMPPYIHTNMQHSVFQFLQTCILEKYVEATKYDVCWCFENNITYQFLEKVICKWK